ncbi:rRNA maturation RNase YbeY [Candidatus Clostridium stratigraminis]|uniref:Endoribonuclease YbeY n=1 Tax=Candidatus Clostridium stratigraminis TaxID=3381661 RepID=A0ABW8T5L1_9CLOT
MILIDNRQNNIILKKQEEEILKEIIDYTLKEEGVNIDYEVSVIFVDNTNIRELNLEFRNIDRETDVLSFPMLEYTPKKVYKDLYIDYHFTVDYFDEKRLLLGDIALSLEKAKEQSEEFGHSFIREICYLTIHSLLHLLGYDHIEEDDKLKMRMREEEILGRFNIIRSI